jgi:hypothetical protein
VLDISLRRENKDIDNYIIVVKSLVRRTSGKPRLCCQNTIIIYCKEIFSNVDRMKIRGC